MADNTYSAGSGTTIEDVKAAVEARVQSAIDIGKQKQQEGLEIAEPEGWWNLWAYGPFQFIAPGGPLRPHKVIKAGESFYVATVLWLSDVVLSPGGPTVCDLISNLACDFQLEYCTNDLCAFRRATRFSRVARQEMYPDSCYYVDVQEFYAQPGDESCIYEMNVCARITGCKGERSKPTLAGFATAVYDFDPDLFYPPYGPSGTPAGWKYDNPIRFMIYP
jgi:hypothetical protein